MTAWAEPGPLWSSPEPGALKCHFGAFNSLFGVIERRSRGFSVISVVAGQVVRVRFTGVPPRATPGPARCALPRADRAGGRRSAPPRGLVGRRSAPGQRGGAPRFPAPMGAPLGAREKNSWQNGGPSLCPTPDTPRTGRPSGDEHGTQSRLVPTYSSLDNYQLTHP